MSIVSKSIIVIAACACTCGMFAGEIFEAKTLKDFTSNSRLSVKDKVFSFKGSGALFSAKKYTLDPSKKYKLTGKFKVAPKVSVYLGYAPYDIKGRPIYPAQVQNVAGSETVLAAPVKKGDKIIKLKDASKWNKTISSHLVPNAKADLSDMPNYNILGILGKSIKKDGSCWQVTLKNGAPYDMPAGMAVRQHIDGGTYIYNTRLEKTDNGWAKRSGIISGEISKNGVPLNKLWKGTKNVHVLVLIIGPSTAVHQFKDIELEEVK